MLTTIADYNDIRHSGQLYGRTLTATCGVRQTVPPRWPATAPHLCIPVQSLCSLVLSKCVML